MSKIYRDYDLIKQIGTGSFSTIYKAKRKSDGLIVAIKIFEAQNQNEINLVQTEAKVLQHLMGGHPSIPNIYDFFQEDLVYFIIMDYLDGYITLLDWTNSYSHLIFNEGANRDDLQNIIKSREERIATIFTQIISSINYLHRKSVVHRDLKLENIMINPNTLSIKLIDFGFSTISETMVWSTICGSFEYMAPEILQDLINCTEEGNPQGEIQASYTTQSEIWSLGIILYGLVYCRLPFFHTNRIKLIKLVLNTKISFEPENVIYSPILKSLLISMLEKDPAKRITFIKIYNHPFLTNKSRRLITGRCHRSMSYKSGINMMTYDLNYKSDRSSLEFNPLSKDKNSESDTDDLPKANSNTHFLPITFRMSYNHKIQRSRQFPNFAKPFVMEAKSITPKRLLVH